MKIIITAVVLLVVAMGVQSSFIPGIGLEVGGLGHSEGYGGFTGDYGDHAGGYGGFLGGYGGLGLGHDLGHGLGFGHGTGFVASAHVPAAVELVSSPHAYSYHSLYSAPAVAGSVAHQAAVASPLVPHGATYVAKNHGAIHTAPLAGHVHSVASINLAPAPGTW